MHCTMMRANFRKAIKASTTLLAGKLMSSPDDIYSMTVLADNFIRQLVQLFRVKNQPPAVFTSSLWHDLIPPLYNHYIE